VSDNRALELGLMAKLVVASAALLIIVGMLWHGVTLENFKRVWGDLTERPSGPMAFRFILQPLMAAIAAIHHGLQDARRRRSPYLWTVLHRPEERVGRLREGINATSRIILLGLTMDVIYQVLVFNMFYPVEAVIIAFLLGFVPYLIIRGLVVRLTHGRATAGDLR
jgi:hypothetical protein